MYIVYIIQSEKDGSFYTGMTMNLERRIHEHNKSDTKTTKARKPWKIVYSEQCPTRVEARQREKFWKSGSGRELRKRFSK